MLLYPVAQEYHGRTVRRGSFGTPCTPGKPINRNMPLWILDVLESDFDLLLLSIHILGHYQGTLRLFAPILWSPFL